MANNSVDNDKTDTAEDLEFANAERPLQLFDAWMEEAVAKELNDPTAMSVATVDSDGMPNIRMVLLKEATEKGFTFYTNFESAKGQELLANPKAALCFHWKSLRRQVRVRGNVLKVEDAEADAYFASRPKGSRIGAWASDQSRELESRYALEMSVAKYTAKYALGSVPRPDHWSGFRVEPVEIEFWRDRPFRLHDRLVFRKETPDQGAWHKSRLYP
ncbi:MAG: pyridoxamine 5'-phosphate oxidase [Methyloligellaceae bacterium]